jgi:predicted permease
MESLLQDLRYALRTIGRMRGTALIAVVTLGAGIAATTTMVSVVYATVFRPLPFPQPDRLVVLNVERRAATAGTVRMRWPQAKIVALQKAARSFDGLASYTSSQTVSVMLPSGPEQVGAEIVSSRYFDVLGWSPRDGRAFLEDEDRPGHPSAILSAGYWRRLFGAQPFAPDRSVVVNGERLTIVGVLPDGFRGAGVRAELWLPIGMAPVLTYRDYLTTPQHFISLIGRLKPGVTLPQANAELAVVGPALPLADEDTQEPAAWSAVARPMHEARVDAVQARSAWLLLGAVVCVLLVTCLNVSTLLLARARLRRREIAVRLAIGAPQGRIVRQLLTEAGVLAVLGGAMGALLSVWGIALVTWLSPELAPPTHTGYIQLGTFSSPRFDAVAVLWIAILTLACTLVSGLTPAFHTASAGHGALLNDAGRASTGRQGRSLALLAGLEVALATLLVAGAFLLVATFTHLRGGTSGFDSRQVLTFWITPPAPRYPPESGPMILERLLQRVQQAPGIQSAAVNRCTPYGSSCSLTTLFTADQPARSSGAVGRHYVSADYFRTLGITVRRGRALQDSDRTGQPLVTVINEAAARRFWPGQDPIGKRVWFSSSAPFMDPSRPLEVVGVVADVTYSPLDEPPGPDFYTSYLQFAYPDSVFLVRTSGDPAAAVPALRAAIAEVDPALAVWDVRLLDVAVADALSRPRFNATLAGAFALTSLALAAIGTFGVMASAVASRSRELAVRLALGSTPAGLRALVLRQALALAVGGSVAGLLAAAALLRLLRGLLAGVTPGNPLALGAAALLIVLVALIAAVLPARRAAMTEPLDVLKLE